jgi:hypothetical protein
MVLKRWELYVDDFSPLQQFVGDVVGIDGRVRPLLAEFANFRKAIISFVLSVRPSVRNTQAPTERICMEVDV